MDGSRASESFTERSWWMSALFRWTTLIRMDVRAVLERVAAALRGADFRLFDREKELEALLAELETS